MWSQMINIISCYFIINFIVILVIGTLFRRSFSVCFAAFTRGAFHVYEKSVAFHWGFRPSTSIASTNYNSLYPTPLVFTTPDGPI